MPDLVADRAAIGVKIPAADVVDKAVGMGAKIINASWGGAPCSEILKERIESLADFDVLFIAAAGNNGSDLEIYPEYPASFELAPQITVGASTTLEASAALMTTVCFAPTVTSSGPM